MISCRLHLSNPSEAAKYKYLSMKIRGWAIPLWLTFPPTEWKARSVSCLFYTFQTPGSPTPSESTGPDSTVTTPTEPETHIPARAFAKPVLSNEQDGKTKELELLTTESNQDDPSIHVDANNKEMKTVLDRTSSTEVIPALSLDSRLKYGSVASINRSDSYASVASNLSNGISEKAGSFTSVASTLSAHQPLGSHHGLVRYRSASGRPLSDIVSTL